MVEWQIHGGVEEKVTPSIGLEPIDLGETDDDAGDDLNLEVEKHRRRANAAVLALEAAAKEADEDALMNNLLDSDSKQGGHNALEIEITPTSNRKGSITPPYNPSPAEATRKGRPAQGHAPW